MPPAAPCASLTVASSNVPVKVPLDFSTLTVWPSTRSTSVNAITPELLSHAWLASSTTAPWSSVVKATMVGRSLVPVMVTVTSWSTVEPLPSSMVTVKVSTAVSPWPRYSVALLSTV